MKALLTDLDSHHIEGFATHGGRHFSVPLLSQITDTLWTGGCVGGVQLPEHFEHVISLYPWENYRMGEVESFMAVRLYDSTDLPDVKQLLGVAEWVNVCRWRGPTLVHCQAGLNRSALVTGIALVLAGMTRVEALAKLREKRCDACLCNPVFENFFLKGDWL